MKLKSLVVLSLLVIFSLGSMAYAGSPAQNNNKHRMENRGDKHKQKWRRKHRRRHRRHSKHNKM